MYIECFYIFQLSWNFQVFYIFYLYNFCLLYLLYFGKHTNCRTAHPGGAWMLEFVRGRDVTAIFHAIHWRPGRKSSNILEHLPRLDMTDEAVQISEPYIFRRTDEAEEPLVPSQTRSAFANDLRQLFADEFPVPGSEKASVAHSTCNKVVVQAFCTKIFVHFFSCKKLFIKIVCKQIPCFRFSKGMHTSYISISIYIYTYISIYICI